MSSKRHSKKLLNNVLIDESNKCWEWVGAKSSEGYGRYNYQVDRKQKHMAAHRLSYTLFIGPIKDKFFVCHKCDNPCCVNPDHLFLGTHKENMDDMRHKGRSNYKFAHRENRFIGEKNGRVVLSEGDVIKVLQMRGHASERDVARTFNVAHSSIRRIWIGATWKHITLEGAAKNEGLINASVP